MSGSPSPFGTFHKIFLPIKNAPAPAMGTRTENTFLRYHLVCRKSGHSIRCQHTGCPVTQAMRQKILGFPLSLCPRRPICCPAFRSALSCAKLSVDALAVLLPPQWFSLLFLLLNYINVFLSRTFFHLLRNWLP